MHSPFRRNALAFIPFGLSLLLLGCRDDNPDAQYLQAAWSTMTGTQSSTAATASSTQPPPEAQEYGAQGTITPAEARRARYYALPQSTKAIHSLLGMPAKYSRDADYYRVADGWVTIHYDANGEAVRFTNPAPAPAPLPTATDPPLPMPGDLPSPIAPPAADLAPAGSASGSSDGSSSLGGH